MNRGLRGAHRAAIVTVRERAKEPSFTDGLSAAIETNISGLKGAPKVRGAYAEALRRTRREFATTFAEHLGDVLNEEG